MTHLTPEEDAALVAARRAVNLSYVERERLEEIAELCANFQVPTFDAASIIADLAITARARFAAEQG